MTLTLHALGKQAAVSDNIHACNFALPPCMQVTNRDMSILVLRRFLPMLETEQTEGKLKRGRRGRGQQQGKDSKPQQQQGGKGKQQQGQQQPEEAKVNAESKEEQGNDAMAEDNVEAAPQAEAGPGSSCQAAGQEGKPASGGEEGGGGKEAEGEQGDASGSGAKADNKRGRRRGGGPKVGSAYSFMHFFCAPFQHTMTDRDGRLCSYFLHALNNIHGHHCSLPYCCTAPVTHCSVCVCACRVQPSWRAWLRLA